MSDDGEVSDRTIRREILVYVIVVLIAGGVFVAFRVAKNGARVLTVAPHESRPQSDPPPR